MHVPAVEVGMLWLSAVLSVNSPCPTPMKCIKAWQECSNGSVTTLILSHLALHGEHPFQQYLDVLLQDLGLNPYRKMPNVLANCLAIMARMTMRRRGISVSAEARTNRFMLWRWIPERLRLWRV